jgi:hypothetical protein
LDGGGYDVDLLPAANLVKLDAELRTRNEDVGDLQRGKVIQKIMENPNEGKYYSSSLAETQINFMKDQDAFCHALVRLAKFKFWYKSVYLGEYVDGAKTIMELVATAAAKREEKQGEKSMLRAFMTFLGMLSKINSLKILFHQKGKNWELFDHIEIKSLIAAGAMKHDLQAIPRMKTLLRDYFIVEPGNPFNDMAEQLNKAVIEKLIVFAEVSKQRLEEVVFDLSKTGNTKGLQFQKLFDPQPTNLIHQIMPAASRSLPSPDILFQIQPATSVNSDRTIRNQGKCDTTEAKNFVKGVEQNLPFLNCQCMRAEQQQEHHSRCAVNS